MDAPWDDMQASLLDLRRINKYLGGTSIYQRMIDRLLRNSTHQPEQPVILDIGTGTSDLLQDLQTRRRIVAIGIDFNIRHLLAGRRFDRHGQTVHRVVSDAKALPFKRGSIDIVTSSHFFHHFSAEENEQLHADALALTNIGVVINDTRRHYAPLFFVRLLAMLRVVGVITREDAPASVLQGYTPEEMREVAANVAKQNSGAAFEIVRMFPFRVSMMLWNQKR